MLTRDDIAKARAELSQKSLGQIHRETAVTWTARGCAALGLAKSTGKQSYLFDAEEYFHEALEHAALVGAPLVRDVSATVARVKAILEIAS